MSYGRVVLATAVAISFVVSAGAFTTTEVDRGVSVTVASDEHALLKLTEYHSLVTKKGERQPPGNKYNTKATSGHVGTVFEVTNQFRDPLTDIEAVAHTDHPVLEVAVVETPESLDVGETGRIRAEFDCEENVQEAFVDVSVTVRGDGIEATRMDKTVRVQCTPGNEPTEEADDSGTDSG